MYSIHIFVCGMCVCVLVSLFVLSACISFPTFLYINPKPTFGLWHPKAVTCKGRLELYKVQGAKT